MAHEKIEVNLPLAKVYELLNSPTEFPTFMDNLGTVNKLSSQSYEFITVIGGEEFKWTTNVIDDLRNTRFAWITINGNLNQTGTIRFTPLDNGSRTRVDFSLDYRTFFGDPSDALAKFIEDVPAKLAQSLAKFKQMAESDAFKAGKEKAKKEAELSI